MVRLARKDDVVVEVSCRCGTEWVQKSLAPSLRNCRSCRRPFTIGVERRLGKGGSL